MVVGQSLILGLGKLLDTAQTQSEVFNTFEHVPYVAVQISSNTETELAMSAPFLGQHHGLDIPRSQLKYILPMLSAKHMNSNNVFAEHTVSRRYARVLFAHAQETIWKHIEDSIAQEAMEPSKVVMLINMGDSFANAVWMDCLFGLQQRYPHAQYYPVFLFPESAALDDRQTAIIGAAVTELHQLSLGQFVPQDLNTGRNHVLSGPLWTVANLQQLPLQKTNLAYWNMVRAVLNIAQVKHPAHGTLNQCFQDEYAKALHRKDDKASALVPRFASTFRAGLDMDRATLLQHLQQQCQAHTMAALPHHAPMSQVWGMKHWLQMGCVLSAEQLGLDVDLLTDAASSGLYAQWQQHVLGLLQTEATHQEAHTSPLAQIEAALQNLWQQAHTGTQTPLMREHAALADMAKLHVQTVTQQLWTLWQQGKISLAGLNEAVVSLLQHDAKRTQTLLDLQARLSASQQHLAADFSAWQVQDSRTGALLWREDAPVAVVAAKMAHGHAQKLHLQAAETASTVLGEVQTQLRAWQQQLLGILQCCNTQEQAVAVSPAASAPWFKKISGSMNCQLLLQPNQNTLQAVQTLVQPQTYALLQQWQQHTAADVRAGMADLAQCMMAHKDDAQAWLPFLKQEVMQQPAVIQQILRQRILDLDAVKILQLAEISLLDINNKLHFFIQPLGEVLTKKHRQQTSTCLVCDEDLREHDVVSVMMNLCQSKNLRDGSVVSHAHCLGAEFLHTNTCYLDEWFAAQLFIKAYRQYSQNEESMLHLHIDGNVESILNLRQNSVVRNRELIRQHLLLAFVAGNLKPTAGLYRLNVHEGVLFFKLKTLAELVDQISLHDVQILMNHNHQLHHELTQDAETMQLGLRMALEQVKLETLPKDVALEDANWQDAGRYVAWSRAARQLLQQWTQLARKAA